MEKVVPWKALVDLIEPHYPKTSSKGGRPSCPLQTAERAPAAEVYATPEVYEVVLELPGIDKAGIEVKATERTLLISAERRSQRPLGGQPSEAAPSGTSSDAPAAVDKVRGPLLIEFRNGTWSRSFRFPVAIEREHLQAVYRDGLLTVTVKVEG